MSGDSKQKNKADTSSTPKGPETRGERWAKYGSNVALMIVVSIVLAALVTYIAQAHPLRLDTTSAGVNSLRPQTLNVIRDLGTDIKLVSLYSKTDDAGQSSPNGPRQVDRVAMVADLLDNYKRAGKHITTDVIDPTDKSKLDALQSDLDERYGKDISTYKAFLDQYDPASKQLSSLVAGEADKIGTISVNDQKDEVAPQIRDGVKGMQTWLENSKADMRRHMQEHRPDYRGITGALRGVLQKVSDRTKSMNDFFVKNKANPQISPPVQEYIKTAAPHFEEIQKLADEQIARIDKLGELKVDELQQALDVPNPILVLGPKSWRVLSESQVWPANNAGHGASDTKLLPNFAGEQQVTGAIIGLTTEKKPKVVFLRPGGGPLATPGFPPFQAGGPLSDVADRLRQYNFDVLEKDLSGQWAMMAQQRQMMSQPDPSWEDIADAVWIVIDTGGPIEGPDPAGPRLAAHLGHGGSAFVVANPSPGGAEGGGTDPFQSVLREWGVDTHPDLLCVHEQTPAAPNAGTDPFQDFLRRSFVWDLKDYGDATLARPLKNLESLMLVMCPVTTRDVPGYTVTKLLPLPDAPAAPKSWGEKDSQEVLRGTPAKFDKDKDLPGPLFGGAAVEKKDGGRLVVIGCINFLVNELLEVRDEVIAHNEGRVVARFPGNAELATNSVFWCAKMDSMIALSPAALQVSRISDMSPAALNFWRVGLMLVILPGAVLVSGLGVYFARRD